MTLKKGISLLIAVAIPLLIGAIGSIFTQTSVTTWYLELEKPFFNPPNWAFPIAWTTLYVLMGVASWLVWLQFKSKSELVKKSLIWYSIQLIFNLMWSYLFFTLKNPALALVEILILYVLIIVTTKYFFSVNKTAGWLMIPYIAWVSFAILLNAGIVYLN
jgi:benzodiazapine receptor